jgi:hypothetical protein
MTDNEEWIADKDASDWAASRYRLSGGAAQAAVGKAIASKEVRWSRRVKAEGVGLFGVAPGQRVMGRTTTGFHALFTDDLRWNFADLRWWFDRKFGEPKAKTKRNPRKPKPPQVELNAALLDYAKKQDRKLKQKHDQDGKEILVALGATTRQIPKAYRALPAEYRYGKGNPGK